jgi:molecular chaperone DnaK
LVNTGLAFPIRPMRKKILALGPEGELLLRAADGGTEPILRQFVYVCVDCSTSMRGSKLDQAKQGAAEFAHEASRKGYAIGLIRFASSSCELCEPGGVSGVVSLLEEFKADGSTDLTGAIELANEKLRARAGSRCVIVVVTDGEPDDRATALEAARQVKDLGIDIIAIGTDDADQDFLCQLASQEASTPRATTRDS